MQTQKAPRPHGFSAELYSRRHCIQDTQSLPALTYLESTEVPKSKSVANLAAPKLTVCFESFIGQSCLSEKKIIKKILPRRTITIFILYRSGNQASYGQTIGTQIWAARSYVSTDMNWSQGRNSSIFRFLLNMYNQLPDWCWLLTLCLALNTTTALPNHAYNK